MSAARSNSLRASSIRPSLNRKSPRTLGQQVVVLERRLIGELIDELEPGLRPESEGIGHRAVELDHRRRRDLAERHIERRDLRPIGFARRARPRMARRDRCLQRVGPARLPMPSARSSAVSPRRIRMRSQRSAGPARAAGSASPSALVRAAAREAWISSSAARPWTSASSGISPASDADQPQRRVAELAPHPARAGRRGVALVEDQVDDLEDRTRSRSLRSSPRGTSKGMCASAIVFFARTMRCWIVGSAAR